MTTWSSNLIGASRDLNTRFSNFRRSSGLSMPQQRTYYNIMDTVSNLATLSSSVNWDTTGGITSEQMKYLTRTMDLVDQINNSNLPSQIIRGIRHKANADIKSLKDAGISALDPNSLEARDIGLGIFGQGTITDTNGNPMLNLMSLRKARKLFNDPLNINDYNINAYERLAEEHMTARLGADPSTVSDADAEAIRNEINATNNYIENLRKQVRNGPSNNEVSRRLGDTIDNDVKDFDSSIESMQNSINSDGRNAQYIKYFDKIASDAGSNVNKKFVKLRKAVGQQYSDISESYSREITKLYQDFKKLNPDGTPESFKEELAKAVDPNDSTSFAKRKFEIDQKYVAGLGHGEDLLVQAADELEAIEGKRASLTGKDKYDGIIGMARDKRSSKLSSEINEAYSNFNSVTVTDADGVAKNYETMVRTIHEENANGNINGNRELFVREIDSSGKAGTWSIIGDRKTQNRFALALKDKNAHRALSDDAIKNIGQELGIEVPADTNGISSLTRRVYAQHNDATQYINARGVTNRGGVRGFIDDVISHRHDPSRSINANMNAEAAKIARKGVADDSGVFKQLAAAAGDHPFIAAAIAIGGFGLANKALDRRREYD